MGITCPHHSPPSPPPQGLPDAKVAKAGKTVVVKYTGRLKTNGKVFDSTKGNKTFNFKLGVGEVGAREEEVCVEYLRISFEDS